MLKIIIFFCILFGYIQCGPSVQFEVQSSYPNIYPDCSHYDYFSLGVSPYKSLSSTSNDDFTISYWVKILNDTCVSNITNLWDFHFIGRKINPINPDTNQIMSRIQYNKAEKKWICGKGNQSIDYVYTFNDSGIQFNKWYFFLQSLRPRTKELYCVFYDGYTSNLIFESKYIEWPSTVWIVDTNFFVSIGGIHDINPYASINSKFANVFVQATIMDFLSTDKAYWPKQVIGYMINENSGQFLNDITKSISLKAYLGISPDNITLDPSWTNDNTNGLIFSISSIITGPSNSEPFITYAGVNTWNNWYIDFWVYFSTTNSACQYNWIFTRRNNSGIIFGIGLNNTNTFFANLGGQIFLSKDVYTRPSSGFIRISIGFMYSYSQKYFVYTLYDQLFKSNTIANYFNLIKENNNDNLYIGDSECSFCGKLRMFQLFRGSLIYATFDKLDYYFQLTSRGFTTPPSYLDMYDNTNICPSGSTFDQTISACINCDMRCITCISGSNTQCGECNAPFILSLSSLSSLFGSCDCPPQKPVYNKAFGTCCSAYSTIDITTGSCILNCPNDTFKDIVNSDCVIDCPINTYRDSLTMTCESQCTGGQFADSLSGNCVTVCSSGCYDLLSRKCISTCPLGTFLDSFIHSCVSATSCWGGYVADPDTRKCISSCPSNYPLDPLANQCVKQCPKGTFADSNGICKSTCQPMFGNPLNQSCVLDCPAPLLNDKVNYICVQNCPPGYFVSYNQYTCVENCSPYYGDPITRMCSDVCPSNYYKDPGTYSCVLYCPSGTFANMSNICVNICDDGTYGDSLSRACQMSCPDGYFKNSMNKLCESICSFGFIDTQTQSCLAICPLPTYGNPISKLCEMQCPQGLYGDPAANRICSPDCSQGIKFDGTRECINTCPSQFYQNNEINKCESCSSSCFECSITSTNCTSCNPQSPDFRYLYNMNCIQVCPPTTYPNLQNQCSSCHEKCKTCNGDSEYNCLSCDIISIYKYYYKGNYSCLENCPSHTYTNNSQTFFICNDCDVTCTECLGPTNKNCTSCGSYLQFFSYFIDNQCFSSCPPGYYEYGYNCQKCHETCSICNGPGPNDCLFCNPQTLQSLNNNCSSISNSGNNGIECSIACETCFGDDNTKCITCASDFAFILNETNTCLSSCPLDYYIENNTTICKPCHESCRTCIGPLANQCKDCNEANILYNNSCFSTCPNGTYLTLDKKECRKCDDNCLTCVSSPDHCSSCRNAFYLDYDKLKCLNCSENCTQCVDYADNCTECRLEYKISRNYLKQFGYFCVPLTTGSLLINSEIANFTLVFNQTLMPTNQDFLQIAFNISIDSINETDYTYIITQISPNQIQIILIYFIDIINKTCIIEGSNINPLLDINHNPVINNTPWIFTINYIQPDIFLKLWDEIKKLETVILLTTSIVIIPPILINKDATIILWSSICILQEIYYYVFLNMNMPRNFRIFLKQFKSKSGFTPNLSNLFQQLIQIIIPDYIFPIQIPPQKFEDENYNALFIVTGSSILLYIVLLCIIVRLIDKYVCRNSYCKKLKLINSFKEFYPKWNALITFIDINFYPLIFAISLQFFRNDYTTITTIISNILAVIAIIIIICYIIWIIWLLNIHYKNNSVIMNRFHLTQKKTYVKRLYKHQYKNLLKKYKYKNSAWIRNFTVIMLFHKILYIGSFMWLYYYPIICLISLSIQNIGIIIYIVINKPHINNRNNIIIIIHKLFYLCINTILLYCYHIQESENNHKEIGWILILLALGILFIKILFIIYEAYLVFKRLYKSFVTWLLKRLKMKNISDIAISNEIIIPDITEIYKRYNPKYIKSRMIKINQLSE